MRSNIEAGSSYEERLQSRVLHFLAPIFPLFGITLETTWYFRTGFETRMIAPLICIAISLFVPAISRKFSLKAASILFCSIIVVIVFVVGLDFGLLTIQVVVWLPAMVILMVFLLGRFWGTIFNIIIVIEAALIYILVDIGPIARRADHDDWVISLVATVLASLSVLFFALMFLRVITHQQSELAEKNRFLQVLMGGISHDLRSPLATINMFSKILMQKQDAGSLEKYLNKIVGVSENALKLTENLLEIAVYDQGLDNINKERVEMKAMAEAVMLECQPVADKKNISLNLEVDSEVFVLADSVRIKQVMINLITNAIKFSPQKQEVLVQLKEQENMLQVQVSDKGIGIDEKMIRLIFSEPSRSKRAGTEGEKSTGYGLLLCRYILELHDSELQVVSQPGQGSSFSFSLTISE